MAQEKILESFVKNLKIAFDVAAYYNKDHPFFVKSVEKFKAEVDATLAVINPIIIEATHNALIVGKIPFSGRPLYEELAKMFHLRKIKQVEIKKDISSQELITFLSRISCPVKDIFRLGGVANVLKRDNLTSVSVTELDYSQLLKEEGSEYKDTWVYLLKEAVETGDKEKLEAIANSFGKMIRQFKAKDLLDDEEAKERIHTFLSYLKKEGKENYTKCSKEMARSILLDKQMAGETNLSGMNLFFKDFNEQELAEVLADEIVENQAFDSLSFGLFSRLVDNRSHQQIATLTEKSLRNKSAKDSQKIKKRIENLFSRSRDMLVSDTYRNTLFLLLDELSFKGGIVFDRDALKKNYFFVLLNLLTEELDPKKVEIVLNKILDTWEDLTKDKDLNSLKCLEEILEKKRNEFPELKKSFSKIESLISAFMENAIWDEGADFDVNNFLGSMKKSSLGANLYIERIFEEGKVNANVMKLFIRFFPDNLTVLYKNLRDRITDIELIGKIVESLEDIDSILGLEILKQIFSFSNNMIRIEVLRAMGNLSRKDNTFLLSVLEEKGALLRKESLLILAKDESIQKEAFEKMFLISNPLGRRNQILLENIGLVKELNLRQAEYFLKALAKRSFLWSWSVRSCANKVIKEWS